MRTAGNLGNKHEAKRAIPPDALASSDHLFELQDALAQALMKLSAKHREAIALVYFEELERQTAAKALSVNRDTLSKWLEEALERLKGLVTLPAALLAGGTLSVQSVLSARPPAVRLRWLREIAQRAATQAAASGRAVNGLVVALGIGLVASSGLAVAGWQLLRDPAPDPALKGPEAAGRPRPAVAETAPIHVETVPERNLRIYRAEVLPKQLDALRQLVIGDGTVELEGLEAYDIRLRCRFILRHGSKDLPGWVTKMEFIHRTKDVGNGSPRTAVYLDLFGNGKVDKIDVKRPIVLWRNPLTRKETVLNVQALEAAAAALGQLPHDLLSEADSRRPWHGCRRRPARTWAFGTTRETPRDGATYFCLMIV